MVLHQRKSESKAKPAVFKEQNELMKGPTNEEVTSSWSILAIAKNILKGLLLLIFIPAFLNYAALVREERELKPEGLSYLYIQYFLLYIYIIFLLLICPNKVATMTMPLVVFLVTLVEYFSRFLESLSKCSSSGLHKFKMFVHSFSH